MKTMIFSTTVIATVLWLASCSPAGVPTPEEERNLSLMTQVYDEVVNGGNDTVFNELFDDQFIEHEDNPGFEKNKEGVRQLFHHLRTAFPDVHFRVDDMFASGDKVVTRLTFTGTNEGEFMGMPATGKSISVNGIDIVRFANGKLVEHWGLMDNMTMMDQLGVMGDDGDDESM